MRTLSTFACLALGSSLCAQSTYVSSPTGFLSTEGNSAADYALAGADSRYMFVDGEVRGPAMGIKEVAYRLDRDAWRNPYGTARTWQRITLAISDADLTKLSTTFSRNPLATPTRVFAGAVSWPAVPTNSPVPAPWGGTNGEYRFVFSSTWVYGGTTDICLDFDLTGGSASGGYGFDSYVHGQVHVAEAKQFGGNGNYGCRDLAYWPNAPGGAVAVESVSYSSTHPDPARRGMHEVTTTTKYTAPSAPFVRALGLGGIPAGLPFPGIQCNKLHVDLSRPLVLFPLVAGPKPVSLHQDQMRFAHVTVAVGTEFWTQAIWNDSNGSEVDLTNAIQTSVPIIPIEFKRTCIWVINLFGSKAVGYGPESSGRYNPIVRYGR